VLRSFRDKDTEAIWRRQRSRKLDTTTQRAAWRKLAMLDAAETLGDLAGNWTDHAPLTPPTRRSG